MRVRCKWIGLNAVVSLFFGCGPPLPIAQGASPCPLGDPAAGPEGFRRLALVVGVGQYKEPSITDLPGPPNDARRFYDLLTRDDGYGFPKQNVCLLLDEEATTERFKAAFEEGLVRRAQASDVAVVFFAGHGSQTPDRDQDEPDEWDETLVLHDSRSGGIPDLVDDEFNAMLARLSQKTRNVVVVLDSCNSGTATRGDAGTFIARYVPPAVGRLAPPRATPAGDAAKGWAPENLPGLVVFSAASDGTSALETGGKGIFTDAVIQVLSAARATPLLYAQAARQIPPLVAARSYQIPYFHGELDRAVFANTTRARPVGWEVTALGPPLKLSGPPLPGLGVGAELRVYSGNVTGGDARDPAKAKATVVIDRMIGLNAEAHAPAERPGAPAIAIGDLAVFLRPADQYVRLKVRLRPSSEAGGVPDAEAAAIRSAIKNNEEARLLVEVTPAAGDFELSLQATGDLVSASGRSVAADPGTLILRGPENRIRNTYPRSADPAGIANDLWRHARQRALLSLQGENGSAFQDNETLRVRLKPAPVQDQCARGTWEQAEPNREQVVPLCHRWKIEVSLAPESPVSLLLGGLILSNSGSIEALPNDARQVRVEPGRSVTFSDTFRETAPLDVQEHVLVFGTQERNPVPWYLLTSTATARSTRGPAQPSALYRALDLYLRPGARGTERVSSVEETTWTLSTVPLRVEANARFVPPQDPSAAPQRREYTIPSFDIRPYLPDSKTSALYNVLTTADGLARRSVNDGFPYKQHAWSKASDEENLREGIDCSRAIWFAFTRSGLPFNGGNGYLATAGMVGPSSRMMEQFESCTDDPDLRLGDIVVYRDEARGVGHVVMVLDPAKRIAWGSHGWDGNVTEGKLADTGVEYQLIKYKKDWQRWDRPGMERKACWRYRRFTTEARDPRGQPGVKALADACNRERQCGRLNP